MLFSVFPEKEGLQYEGDNDGHHNHREQVEAHEVQSADSLSSI